VKNTFALVVAWIAAIAVVAVLLANGRSTAITRGERAAAAMAHVLEENTARTFQAVHVTLGALADTWQLTRPRRNDPAFQALLRQRLEDLPYVRAIFVIAPDGFIIHDTDYPRTPAVSLADRDYFRVHRDNPALLRSVSAPVLSRAPGVGWFVSVTERIGTPEKFEGVLVAAVQPGYFESLYAKLESGSDETLALLHRDGVLAARFPRRDEQIGQSFAHLPLFSRLAQSAQGGYRVDGHLAPNKRIVSYRAIEGLPLVVMVSLGESKVLAEWRRSALGAAVAMLALTLLLGGVLLRERRTRRRRAAHRAQRIQAEKLEAMGQLTGGIAHDFANLLGVISINLQLIARHAGDAQANERAVAAAERAVTRAQALISRLLAFARQQPLALKAADLNALVTEAHPLVSQAAGSGVELVLHLAPALPLVLTDESQFEMALLNLVVNARDAMERRGRVMLRTYADARTGAPCLDVEDNGPGMSEETRRRALEPFFTTKGKSGTGLGLAQVYGFMRQAGGSVQVEAAPGGGTRVRLIFPRSISGDTRTVANNDYSNLSS